MASLDTLAELVGLDQRTKRGFTSRTEVSSSTLGDALPVRFVRLDKLVVFKGGEDTRTLSLDKEEVLYPIAVSGEVRSAVTVQKDSAGQWQAVTFGNAPVAKSSDSWRRQITSRRTVTAGTMSLIEIPTVKAYLLSHIENDVHMVTPLWDIPRTAYKAGVTRPAAEVFVALQPLAKKVSLTVPN